ncbi:MAG TPA: Trk system potassium transporter TrkA [Gaiellaceae bacterium]|nr:Trk system potassium transporter TrkA [Gaiellaceae bacterium]
MRIFIIGAGQVGSTIVAALHNEHELTVIDTDAGRLEALGSRYDVGTVEADGASRRVLEEAGLRDAALVIACTSRDEVNVIVSMFARSLAPDARTIIRTGNEEYLDVWRERQLDVDWVVSSERETALAVSQTIGVPAARQTDVFADGQVQIVEFDVTAPAIDGDTGFERVVGPLLKEAVLPPNSKVASIIRGDEITAPRGEERIQPGDRIVVIGSPEAAKEWSRLLTPARRTIDDIVVFGAGRIGTATARALLQQGLRVRLVESDAHRAQTVSQVLPGARVFHAAGIDPEFLEREHIGRSGAAVFAMRDDAKNYYAATLAKLHGIGLTIAVVHDNVSIEVFERAGVDVAINPRLLTAEEIVRFARDPRTKQVAMLEQDRFEILDITVRAESKLAGKRFRDLPMTGSLIGAVVRGGEAMFPHGDDVLEAGDRAIIFTPSSRVSEVERTL